MTGSRPAKRASQRCSVLARAAMLLLPAIVAACNSITTRRDSFTCPAAATIPELQTLVRLAPGPNGATVQSAGRVNTVTTNCDAEGDNGVVSTVDIEFTGLRTTPAVGRLDLPYFVAMADASGNILGKHLYTISLAFDPNAQVTKASDSVTVHVPLKNAQLGNVYTMVVGFQLDQSQLDYNRAHLQ